MTSKPFSPKTLGAKWDVSPEQVRRLYKADLLQGFKIGKLIRIPAKSVEAFECQNQNTDSPKTGASSPSPSTSPDEHGLSESRLARQIVDLLNFAQPKSGASEHAQSQAG